MLGAAGLHTRQGQGIREIGYWVRADRLRQGLATEAVAALSKVAFEIDHVRRVEIRCDTKNVASAGVPKKAGFTLEGVLRRQTMYFDFPRDAAVWSLIAEDYAVSQAKTAAVRAFDAAGRLLLQ
jgi:RimJ/RimL family protein N-acetyltransferase